MRNDLREQLETLLEAFNEIKATVRREDKPLYERWKAGGFIVDDNIHSMYPNVSEVVEKLAPEGGAECSICGDACVYDGDDGICDSCAD